MKDKLITEKLNMYADALEKKDEILRGAYKEMENLAMQKSTVSFHSDKKRFLSKSKAVLIAASFAVFVGIVFLVNSFFNNLGDSNTPPGQMTSYTFATLSRKVATQSQLEGVNDVKLLHTDIDSDGTLEDIDFIEAYFYYDKATNKLCTVTVKYKAIRNGAAEDVVIISDIQGGLEDYNVSFTDENTPFINADIYKNGEYYTDIYFKTDSKAYYVFIQSPITNAINTYINIF